MARRWDATLLDAIRRALPAPTVHARNLFHTSAAMWDAWAAYDPKASGWFIGSEYFPGGVSGYTIKGGSLKFEAGPTADIRLEWATYYDAADQAGQSRLVGGIHILADDLSGRKIGSECGKKAWALAQRYYSGLAGQ